MRETWRDKRRKKSHGKMCAIEVCDTWQRDVSLYCKFHTSTKIKLDCLSLVSYLHICTFKYIFWWYSFFEKFADYQQMHKDVWIFREKNSLWSGLQEFKAKKNVVWADCNNINTTDLIFKAVYTNLISFIVACAANDHVPFFF